METDPVQTKTTATTSSSQSDYTGGVDLISIEGYRQDGRKADELRHFRVSFNVVPDADGSCYLEHGNCKLLASIYGPYEGESRSNQEQAVINCDFSMTSYCVSERRLRTFGDSKSQKLQMAIQRVFQQALITELYPKSQIDIHLKLIQSDGNDYCPSVNATCLAMINAGIPMKDFVCASTVAYVQNKCIIDLNQQEEQQKCPQMTLTLMPQRDDIIALTCESRVHHDIYNTMLDEATRATTQLFHLMRKAVYDQLRTALHIRPID